MPIIKSATKRVKVANKAAIRNSKTKRSLRGVIKAFHRAITGGAAKETKEAQSQAQSSIDKAAKKGVMHKNKAARKQSQVAKAAKTAAKATPAAKKAAAPKKTVAAKKATTAKKTTAAKKPAAKK